MPIDLPIQLSLEVPVTVNARVTVTPSTGERESGSHIYSSRGLQNPNSVSLMSSSPTPATGNNRMATGIRGPKTC